MPQKIFRPTYAKIDLNALRKNFTIIKSLTNASVMPVIKANAYGHGAVKAAQILDDAGTDIFGVATIEEGIELRENSIDTPILILGSIFPMENFEAVIEYNLTPIIASRFSAKILEETAKRKSKSVPFHLKVDSGMGRVGVGLDTAVTLWNELEKSEFLECEGIFTHFSKADEDYKFTVNQINDFNKVLNGITSYPKYVHAANTAGIINFSDSHFNLVRPGLAIYGLYPEGINKDNYNIEPVLSLHSKIVFLKDIKKGKPVSYGASWVAPRNSKIATICVGYADGYPRALSNKAQVIIKNKKCPVVGRVCMDMIMVDVTDIDGVSTGDEVILMGKSENQSISAEELGQWADTINYEITTGISYRVPRIFIDSKNENI